MKYFVAIFAAIVLFAGMVYPTQTVPQVIAESNRAIPLVTTSATKNPPVWEPNRSWAVEMNQPIQERSQFVEMNQPFMERAYFVEKVTSPDLRKMIK